MIIVGVGGRTLAKVESIGVLPWHGGETHSTRLNQSVSFNGRLGEWWVCHWVGLLAPEIRQDVHGRGAAPAPTPTGRPTAYYLELISESGKMGV